MAMEKVGVCEGEFEAPKEKTAEDRQPTDLLSRLAGAAAGRAGDEKDRDKGEAAKNRN